MAINRAVDCRRNEWTVATTPYLALLSYEIEKSCHIGRVHGYSGPPRSHIDKNGVRAVQSSVIDSLVQHITRSLQLLRSRSSKSNLLPLCIGVTELIRVPSGGLRGYVGMNSATGRSSNLPVWMERCRSALESWLGGVGMGGANPATVLRALPAVELRRVLQSGHVPFVVIKNLSALASCSLGVTDDSDRHRSQGTPGWLPSAVWRHTDTCRCRPGLAKRRV